MLMPTKRTGAKGKGKAQAAKGKAAVQQVAKMSPQTRAEFKAALEQHEEGEQ